MSIVWAAVIVIVVAAVAIAAMLFVRRRAPEGSYFADGDRAAGVFGVLATGFALLSGFVVFLAFESYDTSRSGAEAEARIVAHQFETVQFLPAPAREQLVGRARVLRAQRRAPGMAADEVGDARQRAEPVGRGAVSQPARDQAPLGVRAGGVREVPRRALRSRGCSRRPRARRRGRDSGAGVDRPVPERRRSCSCSCSSSPTAARVWSCRRR